MYAVLVSTQSNAQFNQHQLWPGGLLGATLDTVWNKRNLGQFMLNSLLVSVIIARQAVTAARRHGVRVLQVPGKWLVFGFVLVTLLMPTEISILALFKCRCPISADAGRVPPAARADRPVLRLRDRRSCSASTSPASPPSCRRRPRSTASPWQFLFKVLIPFVECHRRTDRHPVHLRLEHVRLAAVADPHGKNQVVQVGLGCDQRRSGAGIMAR